MRDLEGIRQIGEIINSHGNKGELKVVPLTDDTDLFLRCQSVILLVGEQRRLFDVIKAKPVKNTWIVQLAGISNIESAKKLKKIGIYVREDQLKPLAEDEFSSMICSTQRYIQLKVNFWELLLIISKSVLMACVR